MNPNSINITISVTTPEAAHTLLQDLGLLGQHGPAPARATVAPPADPAQPAAAAPAYPQQAPYPPVAPTASAPAYQPQSPAPVYPPQQPAYAPPPAAPAAPVGQPPVYTMEDLSRAAVSLMDAGREINSLLASFGVQALTQLPKEQYGAFATALRQMGARI